MFGVVDGVHFERDLHLDDAGAASSRGSHRTGGLPRRIEQPWSFDTLLRDWKSQFEGCSHVLLTFNPDFPSIFLDKVLTQA